MKRSKKANPRFVYGPVPSRRFGFSLGIDILPFKTCSFDCLYCQLGRTGQKIVERKKYFRQGEILEEIKEALQTEKKINYITFSGSGEPTLNTAIGRLILGIKKMTSIPVAVLTNSSLLWRKEVRKALAAADVVAPTLDAASEEVFRKIHRPQDSLCLKKIIQGLKDLRKEFPGEIWLEVMLVKGVNDEPAHLWKLKEVISEIQPDRIQINTVWRPPAEKIAQSLSPEDLKRAKEILGETSEIIAHFPKKEQARTSDALEGRILSFLFRRPGSLEDISVSLGTKKEEIEPLLESLCRAGKIRRETLGQVIYYVFQKKN